MTCAPSDPAIRSSDRNALSGRGSGDDDAEGDPDEAAVDALGAGSGVTSAMTWASPRVTRASSDASDVCSGVGSGRSVGFGSGRGVRSGGSGVRVGSGRRGVGSGVGRGVTVGSGVGGSVRSPTGVEVGSSVVMGGGADGSSVGASSVGIGETSTGETAGDTVGEVGGAIVGTGVAPARRVGRGVGGTVGSGPSSSCVVRGPAQPYPRSRVSAVGCLTGRIAPLPVSASSSAPTRASDTPIRILTADARSRPPRPGPLPPDLPIPPWDTLPVPMSIREDPIAGPGCWFGYRSGRSSQPSSSALRMRSTRVSTMYRR